MENKPKPPTQTVGVSGFKADLYANDEVKIRWHDLIHIPKFQMFCVEQSRLPHDNVMEWIDGYVKDQCYKGESCFFQVYMTWHDKKRYWKQEDYYGNLING